MKIHIKRLISCWIILSMVACGQNKDTESTAEENSDGRVSTEVSREQFIQGAMELGPMVKHEFPVIVEATGMIDVPPENKAVISSFTDGFVKRTPLLVGDKVKKGQFLLSLENPEFLELQQQYLDAMEQMNYLRSEFERQRSLKEEEITSEKNFLKAESEYKRNLSRYNALSEKLKMLNIDPGAVENGEISPVISIYSPISGSITAMMVNKGKYVTTADELMRIINPDHIHIELNVFEKNVLQLRKGQDMFVILPEVGSDSIAAEVYLVGSSVDEKSRTVKVHGHFKKEDTRHYATGMFVNAGIVTDTSGSMALPSESIVNMEDRYFVLLLGNKNQNGYSFTRREVKPGAQYKGYTSILNSDDFSSDDQFLLQGAFAVLGE
ncbi:MAG: efflux RND transporter periplasmic adaptor subunit [Flavobacteriaceae bacterium]|nr:efflux RND transporter periplasmic adaptor subunit [Flavobacteriaceae bacterium]